MPPRTQVGNAQTVRAGSVAGAAAAAAGAAGAGGSTRAPDPFAGPDDDVPPPPPPDVKLLPATTMIKATTKIFRGAHNYVFSGWSTLAANFKTGTPIKCESFLVGDYPVYLQLYPNGDRPPNAPDQPFTSLFVGVDNLLNETVMLRARCEIVRFRPAKPEELDEAKEKRLAQEDAVAQPFHKDLSCQGWSQFIIRPMLESMPGVIHNDTLTIKMTIEIPKMVMESHSFVTPDGLAVPSLVDKSLTLEQNLAALLVAGHATDVKIHTGDGQVLHAHKSILVARSPVFDRLFADATSAFAAGTVSSHCGSLWFEGKTGVLEMPRFGTTTLQCLLVYLYTGKLPDRRADLPRPTNAGLDVADPHVRLSADASPAPASAAASSSSAAAAGAGAGAGSSSGNRNDAIAAQRRKQKGTAVPISGSLESPTRASPHALAPVSGGSAASSPASPESLVGAGEASFHPALTWVVALELYDASCMYELPELGRLCAPLLLDRLSPTNVVLTLKVVARHTLTSDTAQVIVNSGLKYLMANIEHVPTPGIDDVFVDDKPTNATRATRATRADRAGLNDSKAEKEGKRSDRARVQPHAQPRPTAAEIHDCGDGDDGDGDGDVDPDADAARAQAAAADIDDAAATQPAPLPMEGVDAPAPAAAAAPVAAAAPAPAPAAAAAAAPAPAAAAAPADAADNSTGGKGGRKRKGKATKTAAAAPAAAATAAAAAAGAADGNGDAAAAEGDADAAPARAKSRPAKKRKRN